MCNASNILLFVDEEIRDIVYGKSVLDVGSSDVNGSIRKLIQFYGCNEYCGIDMENGRGVDFVVDACELADVFGLNAFDVVISTNTFEHIFDFKLALSNVKRVCKPGGHVIIVVPVIDIPYHGYPHDWWRYSQQDLKDMFSDFEDVRTSTEGGSIMVKAKKPINFIENDLTELQVYSIVLSKKILDHHKYSGKVSRSLFKQALRKKLIMFGRKLFGTTVVEKRRMCEL